MVPILGLQRIRRFEKPGKVEDGPEKGLANLFSRRKIAKEAHSGRRQEIRREIPGLKSRKFCHLKS
jgi:hypothetical protein